MLHVLMLLSLIIIGLALVSGFLMLWNIPLAIKTSRKNDQEPLISIIIPARNEEKRMVPLLKSLQMQQFKPHEIIVIDDDSTDKTAETAKKYGAQVISKKILDDGWIGKSAACWSGATAATGEWFLFLDADTSLKNKDSLARMIETYHSVGARGILSFQPYHTIQRLYENASAIFNIIVMAGMNVFTPWREKFQEAGSFGPCLLTNKNDYFASGGHEAIGDAVMDDLELGQAFKQAGFPVRCYGGRGVICFRMYPEGMSHLLEGWTKNFGTASKSTHPFVMALISVWVSGGFLTPVLLLTALFFTSPAWIITGFFAYVAYLLQFMWLSRRTGNFHFSVLVFYPLLFLFFTLLFLWSLYLTNVRRSVNWRGRKINV